MLTDRILRELIFLILEKAFGLKANNNKEKQIVSTLL